MLQQKSLFGAPDVPLEKEKPAKTPAPKAPKPPMPSLDLTFGFNNSEIIAEAVFWHRLIINQNKRSLTDSKARQKFTRAVISELKLKQGRSCPLNLMRDMLLMRNFG